MPWLPCRNFKLSHFPKLATTHRLCVCVCVCNANIQVNRLINACFSQMISTDMISTDAQLSLHLSQCSRSAEDGNTMFRCVKRDKERTKKTDTSVCHNEISKKVDSRAREETLGSIHMWGKFCCHCAKLPAISPAWLSQRQMALWRWGVTRVHSRVAFASTSSSQSETSLSERTSLQSGRDRGQHGNFSSHQVVFSPTLIKY